MNILVSLTQNILSPYFLSTCLQWFHLGIFGT
jgi:hypothetical protein